MIEVKMNKTFKGSEDGITVRDFFKDHFYKINEKLADTFVRQLKVAEYASVENKNIEESPQNKMMDNNYLNKLFKKNKKGKNKWK